MIGQMYMRNRIHCIEAARGLGESQQTTFTDTAIVTFSASHCIEQIMAASAKSGLLRTQAWIGGRWRTALSTNTFPVYNPSTSEVIAEVWLLHINPHHRLYLCPHSHCTVHRLTVLLPSPFLGTRHGSRGRGHSGAGCIYSPETVGSQNCQGECSRWLSHGLQTVSVH